MKEIDKVTLWDAQERFFSWGPSPCLFLGGVGAGKLLSLDTPIPTPDGWKANGDICSGDIIFDERGEPTKVLVAHTPAIPERMFRIHFTGGTHIDAGGEHLWTAWDYSARKALRHFTGLLPDNWPAWKPSKGRWGGTDESKGPRTVTTLEMFESQLAHNDRQANWAIPNSLPLTLPDASLPIDPYTLGMWLGDGNSHNGDYTGVEPLIDGSIILKKDPRSKAILYRIPNLTAALKGAGLLKNKHVPEAYLRSSAAQRLALLQGLMDTDGTSGKSNGHSTFTNTNQDLASAVFELMCSLGLNPTITESRAKLYGKDCGPVWDVCVSPPANFPMFRLKRKQARLTLGQGRRKLFKYIGKIEEIAPRPSRCLTVDSPNHLYLAGKAMVPTHNTYVGILKMLYLLDKYPGSRGAIVRQRFQQLKKTTAATLWKMLPRDRISRRNDNEGTLTLSNGSQLLLMHLDKPDSLTNLKSLELSFAYVDQAEDISVEAWDTLWERIGRWSGATMRGGWPKDWPYKDRLGRCIPPRYLMASAYSPGFEHWLTSRFWEFGTERKRYADQGYQVFSGSTRDNMALSEEYIAGRLAMGSDYVKRFVDAVEWGAKEGRIFDLNPMSIIEPTPDILRLIRHRMRIHRVMDHGEAVPTAVLWYATDDMDNVFFYREYGAAGMLVSDHRSAIYQLSIADGSGGEPPKYYTNLADPAIFSKNRGRTANSPPTWSVADEYADKRIIDPKTAISWRPAINDEAMTINRVREYMRVDPRHRHPLTGDLGAPRIYFIRKTVDYPYGCHEVLTDIRAARREEVGVSPDGSKLFGDDRDEKVRDHWLDCVRYSIGSRPALGLRAAKEPDAPGTVNFADYMKLVDATKVHEKVEQKIKWRGKYEWGY